MKKYFLLLVICFYATQQCSAQEDSSIVVSLNQQIDDYVVQKNISALEKIYADDFVFSHGSGKVEGKAGWLKSAGKGLFISRNHDSVKVELHGDVAIVKGKLTVAKTNKEKIDRYYLYYIKVYAKRNNNWQMISHSTTSEFHEKGE